MAADRVTEWVGRVAVAALVAGPPASVLLAPRFDRSGAVAVVATMPEQGGWQPGTISGAVGEPIRLRLTSHDVVHGFAIGQQGKDSVQVEPGRVSELTLRFDRPGTYTFYCTRWCGPNHWRMRGTVVVTGAGDALEPGAPAPYLAHQVDLDAPHPPAAVPARRPSAARGNGIMGSAVSAPPESLATRSPAALWLALRVDPVLRSNSDERLWDGVAAAWLRATTPEALESGRSLYARNCAACHGETGRGDGVMVPALQASLRATEEAPAGRASHVMVVGQPADFTRPELLGASPVLLHGKIVRGGMGTGMPSWGPVLTDREAWALVYVLYGFQFAYDEEHR